MFTCSTTFMPNQISFYSKIRIIFYAIILCSAHSSARDVRDEIAASIHGAEEMVAPECADGTVDGGNVQETLRILSPEASDKDEALLTTDRVTALHPTTAAEPLVPESRLGGG
ncbi:hypothetical protein [Azospirillum sp. TSA6c]|uniref:hypothetical protein n=1 Tax=unclassified Azospirillum TaxID=2630922 RepID=UPI000D60EDA3|nr:hypothetical protein [Azospirillum sp. TSA6c]PWC49192.1 hypothetical protein TSA6c_23610 [Azospirillum sp. TSA6c]